MGIINLHPLSEANQQSCLELRGVIIRLCKTMYYTYIFAVFCIVHSVPVSNSIGLLKLKTVLITATLLFSTKWKFIQQQVSENQCGNLSGDVIRLSTSSVHRLHSCGPGSFYRIS